MNEAPDSQPVDDGMNARIEAENRRREAEMAVRFAFDDREDAAALIVRLIEAVESRYSENRDHPVVGPVFAELQARYGEVRVADFTFARRVSMTEAIRRLLAENP